MNVAKVVFLGLLFAVVILAVKTYAPRDGLKTVQRLVKAQQAADPETSTRGFVDIPLPDGQAGNRVVIFAPANCPSDAARRADALASHLDRNGIPYVRSQNAEFGDLKSQSEVDRVMGVMKGGIPVVFVRRRARANPSGDDVVAEYRAGGMP